MVQKNYRYFVRKGVAYIKRVIAALKDQFDAAETGDIRKIEATILKGAFVTEEGADALKKNPILYWLAKFFAPEQLRELADVVKQHEAGAIDENELMGVFYKLVDAAAVQHFYIGTIHKTN